MSDQLYNRLSRRERQLVESLGQILHFFIHFML